MNNQTQQYLTERAINNIVNQKLFDALNAGRYIDATDDINPKDQAHINLWNMRTENKMKLLKRQQDNAKAFARKRFWKGVRDMRPLILAGIVLVAVLIAWYYSPIINFVLQGGKP